METKVYNQKGKSVGAYELPARIFEVPVNSDVIHRALVAQTSNQRRPWAHTKTRGEVRGGGIKPWRQKGTGRARHGSIRSPLWVGGGVSHGPRNERNYQVKINKKMRRGALLSLLSRKLKDKEVVVLDDFRLSSSKTKEAFGVFKNLRHSAKIYNIGIKGGRVLAALPARPAGGPKKAGIERPLHNLPFVNYIEPRNLNIAELLNNKYLVLDQSSIKELEKTYA